MIQNKRVGKRMTKTRMAVINAVSDTPLTIQEISHTLSQQGISHDLATIYRNVDLLIKKDILTKVQFEDKAARYEKADQHHHHHFICEECGEVEDIPLSEDTLIKQIEETHNFTIKRHTLEFFGLCAHCKN